MPVTGDEDAVIEVLLKVFDALIKLQEELGFRNCAGEYEFGLPAPFISLSAMENKW